MSLKKQKRSRDLINLIAHQRTGDNLFHVAKSVGRKPCWPTKFGTYWNQTEAAMKRHKIYIQMDMDGLEDSVVRMLAGINYNKNEET